MVWTAATTNTFFTDANNIGLAADVVASLNAEGITDPDDLLEFDQDKIKAIAKALRSTNPPVIIGAKAVGRLSEACEVVKYLCDDASWSTPCHYVR